MSGRHNMIAPWGTAAVLLLAGCAGLEDLGESVGGGDNGSRSVVFDCDDDRRFAATFSGDRETVRVRTEDDTYRLELTDRDGDEHTYRDDDREVRLVVDNDQAELDIEDEDDFSDCEFERS